MNDPRVSYEKQYAKKRPKASRWYLIITFLIAFALAFWVSYRLVFAGRTSDPKATTHLPHP
ncbi:MULTISPECIES: hypothetical protein [unclassified Flavobacterium]|uniref:hypothetical protein n=1 Tax=unclassified Flavobacterium TaxID=196869 RepID=UPI001F149249|nr:MULTISPECIES: hypothetical protein [unclassified Flavobacterium]UMY64962.1 hypothetical protein MKO97_10615 [Flavobacterium sp. HJ-32-4]HLN96813.1 hypothetical protein [Flavobacterium sp.]